MGRWLPTTNKLHRMYKSVRDCTKSWLAPSSKLAIEQKTNFCAAGLTKNFGPIMIKSKSQIKLFVIFNCTKSSKIFLQSYK